MQLKLLLFMCVVFVAGCLMPVQAGVNAKLGRAIANPVAASFISFATGFVALALYLLATRQFPTNFAGTQTEPFWIWTGGIIGAFFVSIATTLVPRLGATLSFSLIIAGQLFVSILIDKYGLFGIAASAITFKKIAGIVLVVLGVVLIRNG